MRADVIEDLFKKYYNDALLYTLSISRNHAVADDIVSEAFFIALKTADDEILNFKAWLLKVCRNLFLNSTRKSNRQTELDENMADETESVVDSIIRGEEYKALYHAISLLTSSHKEVITLFYFEDLSVKEIAAILERSETVVKVTLYRAREALKKLLDKNF